MHRSFPLHVVWINEFAALVGGAERYMATTARYLRATGVRSTLLYEGGAVAPEMVGAFDAAFPIADLSAQLRALRPDVVYAHQIGDAGLVEALARAPVPVLRFFHDHKLFCLREGKFTTIGGNTCARTIGLGCYACLGFAHRAETWPGLRLQTVGRLRTEQRAHDTMAGYVVGSAYMAGHLAAHGFDAARTHVLPLFVDDPEPTPDVGREPDLLLFVGQLLRGKGLDVLLDAMGRAQRPARLAVIGAGRYEREHRALAAAAGVEGRVSFLGRLSPDDVASFYRRATCLVMPTRAPETFGLVGVEAMSHGTPVIASGIGAIPEWLEDGGSGLLVPSCDAPALAEAIDRVLRDPALARRMGEHGRAVQQARYRPEHHVQPLLALLERSATLRRAS